MTREEACAIADEVFIEKRPMAPDEQLAIAEFIRDELDDRHDDYNYGEIQGLQGQVNDLENQVELFGSPIKLKVAGVDMVLDWIEDSSGDGEGYKLVIKLDGKDCGNKAVINAEVGDDDGIMIGLHLDVEILDGP